jgi:hypothetical protein
MNTETKTISVPTEKGEPMREKLIELLWMYDQMRMMRMSIEECADYLIANGVTVPVRAEGYSFKGSDGINFDYEAEDV